LRVFSQVDEEGDLGSSAGDPRFVPTTVKESTKTLSDEGDNRFRWVVFACLKSIEDYNLYVISKR
jgi:hypothetical protein